MIEVYHLSTCKTCQRVLEALDLPESAYIQDIKAKNVQPEQLQRMYERAGSYEALFSRRARKYRSLGLHEQTLTEEDYKKYILEEYTFLKRPVILVEEQIFMGSAKKQVEAAQTALANYTK